MYDEHEEFIQWARGYDTGDIEMRSKVQHDEWQKLLQCEQIVLNGADDLDINFEKVVGKLSDFKYRK